MIAEDHTVYPTKDGETITNKYASMSVKVRKMDLTVPVGAIIELVNPVGVVYGEFHSQLSVTADDIKVVSTPKV